MPAFDLFLAHNSADKPIIRRLCRLLANRACADLRDGLQAAAIDYLVSGITGQPAVTPTGITSSPTR